MRPIVIIMESWGQGGTERYVSGLVPTLIRNYYDVTLVLLQDDHQAAIDFLPREKVIICPLRKLTSVLRSLQPDIVSLHLYSHLLAVTLICRCLHIRPLTTLHMPLSAWGWRHRLYWRVAIQLAARVVGVSQLICSELPANRAHPVPLPAAVDSAFFRYQHRPNSDNYFVIVALGRLAREKQWPTLIEAIAQLPKVQADRVLIRFYGEGEGAQQLALLVQQRELRAQFMGFLPTEALAEALCEANLSVLPSRFEGLGLAALETMAAGVATITADFPAAREYIEQDVTGQRFAIGDIEALSKLIAWHLQHPDKSARIGRAGQDFVRRHFDSETRYHPYLEILETL